MIIHAALICFIFLLIFLILFISIDRRFILLGKRALVNVYCTKKKWAEEKIIRYIYSIIIFSSSYEIFCRKTNRVRSNWECTRQARALALLIALREFTHEQIDWIRSLLRKNYRAIINSNLHATYLLLLLVSYTVYR